LLTVLKFRANMKALICGACGSMLLLAAPPAFSQNAALKKINIGVPSVTVGNIIIYVAKEAKLYQKYGLDPDIKTMEGSGTAAKAMLAGKIDISPIATPRVIEADLAGGDLVILAHTMQSVIHALMTRNGIRRPEDLRGKKIGISNFGSLTDFLVRHILRQKGLNPDRDVTLVQIGGDAERLAALSRGTIDAAALSFPGYAKAQKLGYTMLWDSSKEIAYPWIEVVTRRATIQRDRERVLSYMKAHLEGIARFKQDATFGRRVIKRTLKIDDEGLVSDSYLLFAKTFSILPYPNVAGMRTSIEYVAQTRPDVSRHKPEEFIDASFVDELEKTGFIKKLYERP
jgi:ABC-type nitrate/sulfonate/bicarbonate transport system substrate-binding protein